MIGFIKKLIKKYYMKFLNNELPIRKVLFNLILFTGIAGGAFSLLLSMIARLPIGQITVVATAEIILIGCFYIANFKGMMRLASVIICLGITVVLFPIMFFSGGGAYSGMPFWFVMGTLFTFLLIEGKLFYILLILGTTVHTACFLLAYYHPELVVDINTKAGTYLDIWQCMMVLSFAIGTIIKFQVRIYNKAIELNQRQNEQLEISKKEAERAKEKALSANQAKSNFLANMSHEIRTPINAVLGMDEMILRECTDETICEYARNIQVAGGQLLSLINQILDFSKIESGKMEIMKVQYEISSLIQDSYSMVAERARKKNLDFKVICDENIPRTLLGDEVRMRQIIVNLLTNAIKYTEKGCVTLNVQGKWKNEKEILLTISVKDTGTGLLEENRKQLFQSFQRLNEEKNYNIEGTGLGLAVVKQLLELMGGEIRVYSIYGEGSEFVIKVAQEAVDQTPIGDFAKRYNQVHPKNTVYQPDFTAPGAQILIVDDVPMNITVAKNMLKSLKVQVDTASSGQECLNLIREKRYHLIFMDHMMPEMDGIEVFHKMNEMPESQNHGVPVIMLTANAISGMKGEYLSEGFQDYLSKPMRGRDIEMMIKKYLPRELVQDFSTEEEPKKQQEDLGEIIPELDKEMGISYCGGAEDIYLDILKEYCTNNWLKELETCFENRDWQNYRVHVHTLKSTSLTVGLPELSQLAKEVESAVKEGDYDTVAEKHPGMIKQYGDILERLEKYVIIL
ncbi:MAG: response regulator [Lachnospiraceae bacterium]|nr:response regulator [Lachnospiraceae bacterium]